MRRPAFIARQASHPAGVVGWVLGWIMSHETAAENARALELLEIRPKDHVLEVGFGHGRTIETAARMAAAGRIAGVEVSSRMTAMALAHNQEAVETGLVELQTTDGTNLPYSSDSFDKAYSVHTIYFWQDAARQLEEISRVLKPGGRFALVFRHGAGFVADMPQSVYSHRSPEQIRALLEAAGFASIVCETDAPLHIAIATR